MPSIDLITATFLAFEGLLFFLGKDSLKFFSSCRSAAAKIILFKLRGMNSVSQLGGGEIFTAGVLKLFLLG